MSPRKWQRRKHRCTTVWFVESLLNSVNSAAGRRVVAVILTQNFPIPTLRHWTDTFKFRCLPTSLRKDKIQCWCLTMTVLCIFALQLFWSKHDNRSNHIYSMFQHRKCREHVGDTLYRSSTQSAAGRQQSKNLYCAQLLLCVSRISSYPYSMQRPHQSSSSAQQKTLTIWSSSGQHATST